MQVPAGGVIPTHENRATNLRTDSIISKATQLANDASSALAQISPVSHDSSIYTGIHAFSLRLVQELQNPLTASKFTDVDFDKFESQLKSFDAELKTQAAFKASI